MSLRNFEARLEDGTFKKEDVKLYINQIRVPPPPLLFKNDSIKDREKIKKAVLEAHKHGQDRWIWWKMSITWKLKILIIMF